MKDDMKEAARAELEALDRAYEAISERWNRITARLIDGRLKAIFGAISRHVALADHRRRQDARRVQAKAYRRQRSGREVSQW